MIRRAIGLASDATARAWTTAAGLAPDALPSPAVHAAALVIAPHPDDEIACAGLLALHRRAGAAVTVVVCTDGRASRAVPGPPDERAATRRAECEAAAARLGVTLVWLGVPEVHDLDAEALAARLSGFAAPVVYAPSRVDFHPVHRAVAAAWGRVCAPDAEVRVVAGSVPLGPLATHAADVGAVLPLVEAASATYGTQARALAFAGRQRRYVAARHRCGHAAEATWTMTGERYRALHAGDPRAWPDAFRGLRPRSFTDPLAWWVGRSERARLAGLR